MKVSVCAQVTYQYEVEIENKIDNDFGEDDIFYCDGADPVYKDICKIIEKNHHVNYNSEIISIVDADTDKVFYTKE